MKKQLLLILITLLPMVALADESGKCGDNLNWTYYEFTHSLVIAGSGDMNNYSAEWDGSELVCNVPWYKYRSDIVSVALPEGLTSIGNYAFYGCSSLTSVIIPNTVIFIGDHTFQGCSSLASVNIPNNVKSIGESAFFDCWSLTAVHITDMEAWCGISFGYYSNPLTYARHLYLNGEEVKDLVIPNSVTAIGNYAFSGCSSLISVDIPNSVTSIGSSAFYSCSGLTSLIIPDSVTSIGSYAFMGCI